MAKRTKAKERRGERARVARATASPARARATRASDAAKIARLEHDLRVLGGATEMDRKLRQIHQTPETEALVTAGLVILAVGFAGPDEDGDVIRKCAEIRFNEMVASMGASTEKRGNRP